MKIDNKILQVLGDGESRGEWEIARRIYPYDDTALRSKRGAWIRCIVQALWRLERSGIVAHFWVSHGEGAPGDRMWFKVIKGKRP